jgi:cyclopropane fatty-acyl-phospholipid synthase-like methyltransferase
MTKSQSFDGNEMEIKTMKLYGNVDRIWGDLQLAGLSRDDDKVIDVATVNNFDCYNYGGSKSAKEAASRLGLSSSSLVLDVGAGIGGPARCISSFCGATVYGVEVQPDLAALGNELSKRCNLGDRVHIAAGDFLDRTLIFPLPQDRQFDAAVSWLVVLHIPLEDRHALFSRIFELLKPGGQMYIEDFFLLNTSPDGFTAEERSTLRDNIYVPQGELPRKNDYIATLTGLGFEVSFEDVTTQWREFTRMRWDTFRANKSRHIQVYTQDTYDSLDLFYGAVVKVFEGVNLGGAKIIIRKPSV